MPPIQQICQTRGVGQFGASLRHNIWFHRLDPLTPNAKTGVAFAHGFLGNADYPTEWFDTTPPDFDNDVKAKELAQRIAMQQIPAIATDLGASTWGNDTVIASYGSTVTFLNSRTGARTDRVMLLGMSMGALTVLNWAVANISKVAAIGLLLPCVDLADIHDNNRGGFQAAVEGAYGGLSGYTAAEPTHNPANFTATLSSVPIRIWYSTDDPICVPSVVTAFGSAVGATMTSLGAVSHSWQSLALANFDAQDAAEWFAQYA